MNRVVKRIGSETVIADDSLVVDGLHTLYVSETKTGDGRKSHKFLTFTHTEDDLHWYGWTEAGVLAAVIDRLETMQDGKTKCDTNEEALDHLKAALRALERKGTGKPTLYEQSLKTRRIYAGTSSG